MRIATLFSGIGSPEQGAKRVYGEVETVFACEWDKFARESYMANYDVPEDKFYKDVNDLNAKEYRGKVDILIGGSPCQAFSLAGLRHGTDDVRGQLIYQYIRVVDECRPEIIVYENVKGIMSIGGGSTIKDFVQALRDIGYHCHYGVVNTKDYGVPQNRERLFLVGFLDVELYHKFHFADKQPLTKRLKDVLEEDVDEKYYLKDSTMATFEAVNMSGNQIGKIGGTNSKLHNSITNRIFGIDKICPTLTTASTGGNQETKIKDEHKIRKLTPRECFRLQDFPDDFKFVVSNSQLYKQAGNSMSVNILEMIFNQIEKAKRGETVGLF